jgi:hypothetical protein
MRLALFRLKSPLLAALAVGAALALVDVTLRCAFGADPDWMPPRFYNYVPYFGSRIARLEQLKRDDQLDEQNLVVVLGTSSVQFGLDPNILDQNDPRGRRWLILATAGASIVNVEIAAQPFLWSSLHPGVIVIGIHPWMLHRDDHLEHHNELSWIKNYSWLTKHHIDLSSLSFIERDRAIAAAGRLFKLPMWEVYEPVQNPWENSFDFPTEHLPQIDLASQWEFLQFETAPDQYHDNDFEVNSFRYLVTQLFKHCQKIVCVLMPETSPMRPYTAADAQFRRAVAALPQPMDVIDLRSSMPDELLHDYIHLNKAGRAKFSGLLPAMIP